MTRFLTLLLCTIILSACASMFGNSTQEMTILAPGANDAVCYIGNGDVVYRAWPPQTIKVSRRSGELKVRCLADGNREQTIIVESEKESIALANVANGFIPGMIIDDQTGALYAYPELVTVDFTQIPATTMPLPYYQKHIEANPDLFGMEEFRPGRAALMRDKYEEDIELKRREDPLGSDTFSGFKVIQGQEAVQSDPAAASVDSSGNNFISDLTKKMNPQVFGTSDSSSSDDQSGLVGGTTAPFEVDDGGVGTGGPLLEIPTDLK